MITMSSKFKKYLSWCLTEKGRTVMGGVVFGVGMSATLIKMVSDTIFVDKYVDFLHLYNKGFPVEVPPNIIDRFNRAMGLLEVDKREINVLKPFMIYGLDMRSVGTTYSKYGTYVGIPINFSFVSKADIVTSNMMALKPIIDWSSPAAQKILDSLILSEKAQMYAIMKEIEETRTFKAVLESLYPIATIMITYYISSYFNQALDLYARQRYLRFILYTLATLFSLAIYFTCKDLGQMKMEQYIDETLADIDPSVIEGAIEYYEKLIERNKALRALLEDGEKKYTVNGNINYLIRQPHLPLHTRKDFFEKKLKELSQKNVA